VPRLKTTPVPPADPAFRLDGAPRKRRPERLLRERGERALRRMRLLPGQRPCAIVETPEAAAAATRGRSDRGAVTAAGFAALKRRWDCRRHFSRNAYMAHPLIRDDIREWAETELSHVPVPGTDTGSGSTATELARHLEAWLNARRWPVKVTAERMGGILRDLGFGARSGRWNCAPRAGGAEDGLDAGTGRTAENEGPTDKA